MVEFKQQLVGDLVAIQPDDVDLQTVIKLPDWQRNLRGTVLAVGPGAPLPGGGFKPMECQVGDRVVFGAASGMESRYQHTLIRIMRDDDIDIVLEGNDTSTIDRIIDKGINDLCDNLEDFEEDKP